MFIDRFYLQYVTNSWWMFQYERDLILSFFMKHAPASIFNLCMMLPQRKAGAENWEFHDAVYFDMHVIPCGLRVFLAGCGHVGLVGVFLVLWEQDLKAMVEMYIIE